MDNLCFFLWFVIGEINSHECESVLSKDKVSGELEASTVDSLVDMPFATVDIQDDCGSKYRII